MWYCFVILFFCCNSYAMLSTFPTFHLYLLPLYSGCVLLVMMNSWLTALVPSLVQRLILFVSLPCSVTDVECSGKFRLIFSSSVKETVHTAHHTKLPLNGIIWNKVLFKFNCHMQFFGGFQAYFTRWRVCLDLVFIVLFLFFSGSTCASTCPSSSLTISSSWWCAPHRLVLHSAMNSKVSNVLPCPHSKNQEIKGVDILGNEDGD